METDFLKIEIEIMNEVDDYLSSIGSPAVIESIYFTHSNGEIKTFGEFNMQDDMFTIEIPSGYENDIEFKNKILGLW